MEVLHDPWLRYVTFFNVVNVYRNLSAICSSRQKPGRTLPDSAYHRLSPLSRPTSSSSTSLPSFPKCRRPTQIKANLQWQLSVTAHMETSERIKEFWVLFNQNASKCSHRIRIAWLQGKCWTGTLSHLCRVSFTSKGTTGEAALGRNLGCAGFCNSGTWVFKVWTKAKCGVLEMAASKRDDCAPTKTECSGSRTSASELWYRKSSQACCPLCETQSVLRQVVCCYMFPKAPKRQFSDVPTYLPTLHEFRGSMIISLTH